MNYPVYAIRDELVGFGSPRVALNEQVAKRDFAFEVNREGSLMFYAPKNFRLFHIGSYNTDSAAFEPTLPEFVCDGFDVFGV